jgi:hypothetical protein
MTPYEKQQRRIAFLALHRDILGSLKPQMEIDAKKYEGLVQYVYTIVENLFEKYPMNGKDEAEKITKTDEVPY